jgi:hypothetical protein
MMSEVLHFADLLVCAAPSHGYILYDLPFDFKYFFLVGYEDDSLDFFVVE